MREAYQKRGELSGEVRTAEIAQGSVAINEEGSLIETLRFSIEIEGI